MFWDYKRTELEIWIEDIYKREGLLKPSDLSIDNVSKKLGFGVTFMEGAPNRAIWDEEDAEIFLDSKLLIEETRGVFFHELGHPLMHYGDQGTMANKGFKELQEAQANQFQLYAAMPFFMIRELDLPNSENGIINVFIKEFNINRSLAKKRVEQIKRRILKTQLDKQYSELLANEKIFNYCKNIKPKEVPKHAVDIVAIAISRKLSKEKVNV
ncbi:ImmA/IrrE family metallo-endopeptidase [Metabacillus halosaccharovorans]|uniref:IrrE N-terminal-like domain-containing protein n=1 Tax=Metabacillus halosaccharovorans TaxID=930124 RepID=A0ABT3DGU5_9BACI|nr:ImmA/IrrE family metallo-endopeptidase [Metabacillus halosaccharovorans]MCV9886275.1 hypothetical protein [Metabacillus halosaccharovorans]